MINDQLFGHDRLGSDLCDQQLRHSGDGRRVRDSIRTGAEILLHGGSVTSLRRRRNRMMRTSKVSSTMPEASACRLWPELLPEDDSIGPDPFEAVAVGREPAVVTVQAKVEYGARLRRRGPLAPSRRGRVAPGSIAGSLSRGWCRHRRCFPIGAQDPPPRIIGVSRTPPTGNQRPGAAKHEAEWPIPCSCAPVIRLG